MFLRTWWRYSPTTDTIQQITRAHRATSFKKDGSSIKSLKQGCLHHAKLMGDTTNFNQCGLAIQRRLAGAVTSVDRKPSSKKIYKGKYSVWMKRNQLKAQKLFLRHQEMKVPWGASKGASKHFHLRRLKDKRQDSPFTCSRKPHKMRNTSFFTYILYEELCLDTDFRWLQKEATTSNLPQPPRDLLRS